MSEDPLASKGNERKRKGNECESLAIKRKPGDASPGNSYINLSGKDKFELFYGSKSPFSQHYLSSFIIDGTTFNCAEQYMMYQKAVVFGDNGFRDKILACKDPGQQKKYGRKVRNFDPEVWKRRSTDVVETANLAKFSQNMELKKTLLATYPRLLVECSPRDRLWGIGVGIKNPKALDMKTWRGRNLLGHTITRVRDRLMACEENKTEEKGKEGETT